MSQSASGSAAGDYDRGAIAFHWVMAVLVVLVGTLGLVHDSFPEDAQTFWINLHAILGLGVLALVAARAGWRLTHPPPPLPADAGELSRRWSRPVHVALYLLLFVIPVFGIVTFVWHGRVFDFGLFRVDPGVAKSRAVFHPTENIHAWLAYTLFVLIGLHVLAALWHQFYRHDAVLRRMWPARRARRG